MIDTTSKTYVIKTNIGGSFEEQLKLFFTDHAGFRIESPKEDENLGQVFTSNVLARFMINLIEKEISPKSKVLDPCIGPNTFFNKLPKKAANCYLTGVEIDNKLITSDINFFYNEPKRELIIGSFFELSNAEKFDFIIQNPPYVRQELLVKGVNSKANIKNGSSSSGLIIPSQSNLYIYFLFKSILHLKENGVMVAVIYDSWLFSSFGTFLKEAFLKLGHLDSIYHFTKSAFADIEVGATVIKFTKTRNSRKLISYYSLIDLNDIEKNFGIIKNPHNLKRTDLLTHSFNNDSIVNTSTSLFRTLESISTQQIQRGTSSIVNKHFIFSEQIFVESTPIIKDVSAIKTYIVPKENAFILSVKDSISDKTLLYLDSVKEKINNAPDAKYKAVKRRIKLNNSWYKVKIKSSGNFIFNYYLRNNIDFIYNPDKIISSDNFYAINIEKNQLTYLAILNSSFTRLSILSNSRSQGNGLRKIQLYEFKGINVIDAQKLSEESTIELEKLGELLLKLNRYKNKQQKVIEQIDSVLLGDYNEHNSSSIRLEQLQKELNEYLK
jgi:adenine-specific DNA-methyltransferase